MGMRQCVSVGVGLCVCPEHVMSAQRCSTHWGHGSNRTANFLTFLELPFWGGVVERPGNAPKQVNS